MFLPGSGEKRDALLGEELESTLLPGLVRAGSR